MRKINGQTFYTMMISAANSLENNKTIINNMNIFPVPDGDTGINMSLTLSAIRELSRFDGSIADCADKVSNFILRAARGNSGAILSLFFRGFSKSLRGLSEACAEDIAEAFRRGTDEAYKAVMKPTEGTILTVMRCSAEKAERVFPKYRDDLVGFFASIIRAADDALAKTPDQLPVLKEVNLVDAGGYGFVVILKGMLSALKNQPVEANEPIARSTEKVFSEFNSEDITFAYCTECIVEKSKKYIGEGSAPEFKEYISGLGDSVVFIDDEDIIKLHVHTNNPGLVMEKALEYGMLASVKIENMKLQHSELTTPKPEKVSAAAEPEATVVEPVNAFGFVSVCMGDGISDTFRDLGVDTVIHGGQTMNPSTQDIIDGVRSTPAKTVFVLPNNKNIYLVAVQASKLVKDRDVIVLNTKSVPQGISAMISFDPSASAYDNLEAMEAAISNVTSMSITHAVRSTTFDGEKIRDGQIIGLVNGSIDCVANGLAECVAKLSEKMNSPSYVTLFYGSDMSEESASEMETIIREKHAGVEIATISGGQPLYDLIISVE
jgi:DAK2 domain fusion protein YloV